MVNPCSRCRSCKTIHNSNIVKDLTEGEYICNKYGVIMDYRIEAQNKDEGTIVSKLTEEYNRINSLKIIGKTKVKELDDCFDFFFFEKHEDYYQFLVSDFILERITNICKFFSVDAVFVTTPVMFFLSVFKYVNENSGYHRDNERKEYLKSIVNQLESLRWVAEAEYKQANYLDRKCFENKKSFFKKIKEIEKYLYAAPLSWNNELSAEDIQIMHQISKHPQHIIPSECKGCNKAKTKQKISNTVTLTVFEAYKKDVGKGIVRIDYSTMESLDVNSDDIIELTYEKKIDVKCLPIDPSDEEEKVIRMDRQIRDNSGAKIGSLVTLKKRVIQLDQELEEVN